MKAFAFLNGSKKSQQQQQQRQQKQGAQLSINITPRSSQDQDPFYAYRVSPQRAAGVQSPAYSTISFFSSRSAPSRTGSGANTPEPYQTMHASDSGSGRGTGSSGKSRPSLTLLRPRLSSDSNHYSSAETPHKTASSSGGGRLNIYSRFGFSKSSSQLPQDVPTTPTYPDPPPVPALPTVTRAPALSAPVTPNRQYQLLHQQMFPEAGPGPGPKPSLPTEVEFPSPPDHRRSPPKINLSIDGLKVPALGNPVSTSILLQRRRAKSLGSGNASSSERRVTNLKIPSPSVVSPPPLPSARAESSASYSFPTRVTSTMPAPKALTTALPPTPMSSAASLTSESSFSALPPTSNRMRSESNSASTRSRSESNSSRARSESNSSSTSSSRHGHASFKSRASKTATMSTMGRLDDFWDGFLKEIDEDMTDLCGSSASAQSSNTPTRPPAIPVRPARLENHDVFTGAEQVVQSVPLVSRSRASSSPRRKGTATVVAAPAKHDIPKFKGTPIMTGPISDLKATRSLRSPPMTAPIVTIARSPDIPTVDGGGYPLAPFKKSASHESMSSLPYLNSPASSFQRSPDPTEIPNPRLRGVKSPQTIFVQSISPSSLRSPVPSFTPPTPSLTQPLTPKQFSQEPSSPHADSQDSRPCSTYSQSSQASRFSQFSLSQFPSPPSVPHVRPTTDNGTFRTGKAAPPTAFDRYGGLDGGEVTTLRFKPIVAPKRAFLPHRDVRAVLFERDENGHAVLSKPLTVPKFASAQSSYSSTSSSSASSGGTGTYVGSDSYNDTIVVDPSHRHLGN